MCFILFYFRYTAERFKDPFSFALLLFFLLLFFFFSLLLSFFLPFQLRKDFSLRRRPIKSVIIHTSCLCALNLLNALWKPTHEFTLMHLCWFVCLFTYVFVWKEREMVCVGACVRACVRVCARARAFVRACVGTCVRACVCELLVYA